MNANQKPITGAVDMGAGGWWVAQLHTDWIDEAEAREALAAAIAEAEAQA